MKTTLEAGRYWIGDPCYRITEDWPIVCEQCAAVDWNDRDGIWVEAEGTLFILIGTAYGDGCYPLMKDGEMFKELGVDSGCLSIIPVRNDCSLGEYFDAYVVEMKEPFEFEAKGGNFTFGDYTVLTDYDNEDDDECSDDYDEDA